MVDANYEKLIYLARITEQAERHEETIKYMEEIVKTKKEDLTVEERNLLSAAFKNCVSARRSAWRSIYGVEVKEKTNESKFLHLVTDLKTLLETELSDLCNQMLSLIDNYLVKKVVFPVELLPVIKAGSCLLVHGCFLVIMFAVFVISVGKEKNIKVDK